ncbi:hypothetical protein ABVK25_005748 [Lepraria finkii]|uniref:Gamma-glutamylcyclotransferase AIG2-like domain-containing protein n=1 Tax=Lepraria finkii TaxID=1340010 RepID=A0ABR4B7I0_9LECA
MSLPLPIPPTYTHPNPFTTLAPPTSSPTSHTPSLSLRRIQYHIATPTAHILATFPPSTSANQPSSAPPSFAALWVDRARAPETECWLFSTYELPHTHHDEAEAKPQLLSLLNAISPLPPPTPRRPDDQFVILGTVNERLLPLLAGSELQHLAPKKVLTNSIEEARDAYVLPSERERDAMGVLGGLSVPYMKWVIAPPSPCPSTSKVNDGRRETEEEEMVLPLGYTYDKVRG